MRLVGLPAVIAISALTACSPPSNDHLSGSDNVTSAPSGSSDRPTSQTTETTTPEQPDLLLPSPTMQSPAREAIARVGVDPCSLLTDQEAATLLAGYPKEGLTESVDSTDGPVAECRYGQGNKFYTIDVTRPTNDNWYNPNRAYGHAVDVGGGWEAYINAHSFNAKRASVSVGVGPSIDATIIDHDALLEIGKLITSRL
ncbi:DUF3558 family protein [Micromonospora lutea]|nr:DUF3558 family protein [Micromonospora lutea]